MNHWNKIEKPASPKARRTSPGVYKQKSGQARLILPADMVDAERADIFSDGMGKLAFRIHDHGDYAVYPTGRGSGVMCITIPNTWAETLPEGTTDVSLTRDGDMLILDLEQAALKGE